MINADFKMSAATKTSAKTNPPYRSAKFATREGINSRRNGHGDFDPLRALVRDPSVGYRHKCCRRCPNNWRYLNL
jgi:hypothetical protein